MRFLSFVGVGVALAASSSCVSASSDDMMSQINGLRSFASSRLSEMHETLASIRQQPIQFIQDAARNHIASVHETVASHRMTPMGDAMVTLVAYGDPSCTVQIPGASLSTTSDTCKPITMAGVPVNMQVNCAGTSSSSSWTATAKATAMGSGVTTCDGVGAYTGSGPNANTCVSLIPGVYAKVDCSGTPAGNAPVPTGGVITIPSNGPSSAISCASATTTATFALTKCGFDLNSMGTATTSPTDPFGVFANVFTKMCDNGCTDTIKKSVADITASCGARTGEVFGSSFSKLNEMIALGCVKDNGVSCLPAFFKAVSGLNKVDLMGDMPTQALDQLCSPCVRKIAPLLGALSASSTSTSTAVTASPSLSSDQTMALSLNFMCMKDVTSGEYCMNVVSNMFPSSAPTLAGSPSPKKDTSNPTGKMCSPCFRRMYEGAMALSAATSSSSSSSSSSADSTLGFLDSLCVAAADGERCLDKMFRLSSSLDSVFSSGTCPNLDNGKASDRTATTRSPAAIIADSKTACTSACKTTMQPVSALGCCLGSIFESAMAMQSSSSSMMPNTPTPAGYISESVLMKAQFDFIGSCGFSTSKCMPATVPVSVSINLPALPFASYSKNKAAVEESLKKDLALAAGISATSISVTVTALPAPSTGVKVTASITVQTSADGVAIQKSLSSQLAVTTDSSSTSSGSTLSFASTSAVLASDPTVASAPQPIVAGSGSSVVAYAPNSASSIKAFSFAALVASFVALFLARAQ